MWQLAGLARAPEPVTTAFTIGLTGPDDAARKAVAASACDSGYTGDMYPPRRIVCLTEETVETLYLLGEQDRIVGVSGYAVRPPEVRSKPRVSAFTSAWKSCRPSSAPRPITPST